MSNITNDVVAEPMEDFIPSKRDLKKSIGSLTSQIKKKLKNYAGLMDKLLKKADKLDEINEKQKISPKNRALAKASVKTDLEYQNIESEIAAAETDLDAKIKELAESYYFYSDFAKNEAEKTKIRDNGSDVVQNFENLKADIEARVKDKKAIGDIDYYLKHADDTEEPDEPAPEKIDENENERDHDMNAYNKQATADSLRIDALADEVRRLAAAVADIKDRTGAPAVPPYGYPYPPERPSYRLAPVTIDISKEITKAVECAMEKFGAALEMKINEYVASLPAFVSGLDPDFDITETVNEALQSMAENVDAKIALLAEKIDEVASNSNVANMEAFGHAYQLAEQVSDDENFIMNKLTGMLENVKELNEKMLALSATHMEIAEKQKEIVDLQRQTNDVQRYTLREQEGVQVNQKVIGKDQIAIVENQAIIAEEQKNIAAIQAEIVESQKVTTVDQKAVLDAQTALEDAMKSIIDEQDNLNKNQREILKENAQNYDIQQEIASLQVEITNAQKDVIGSQKQLFRDQKALTEKQKANGDLQAEINEDLKTVAKNTKALADSLAKTLGKKNKKEAPATEG